MKNNSSIKAKGAVPGGVKSDESFTKRSGATQKLNSGRKGNRADYGPRTSSNAGKVGEWSTPSASDDNAGTRSRANLPPDTEAMKSPPADLPDAASELASATLPVPSADTPLFSVQPWDEARDRKLGRQGS